MAACLASAPGMLAACHDYCGIAARQGFARQIAFCTAMGHGKALGVQRAQSGLIRLAIWQGIA